MSNQRFKIVEEGYWVGNGCDCCEPDYFPTYRVFEVMEGGDETEVFLNGTPHDVEGAYHGILEYLGVDIEVEYSE
jgi:hypothetical protein